MSIQLIHGDCLKVMPTLNMADFALIFADLPYSCTAMEWDTSIDLSGFWSLANKSRLVILTATQPFATQLICSNRKNFRYDLVWSKQRGTGHLLAKKRPMRSHEHILVFSRNAGGVYNPQKTSGHEPIRSSGKSRGTTPLYKSKLVKSQHGVTERYPLSVLNIATDNIRRGSNANCSNYWHPTQKPVALLEYLIRSYTNPGDTVLDPTAGSGTTAIAAIRTGRRCVCVEKDRTYYQNMVKRVEAEQAQQRTNL